MERKCILLAAMSLAGMVTASVLYWKTDCKALLSIVITFGTISYHIVMRLLVGMGFHSMMKNKADYKKRWYQVNKYEIAIYERMHIKKWKRRMPTYDRTAFDPQVHTWTEIAQAMCQAELVHETIALLSFIPIAGGKWFGAYPVFIMTSILAAGCDMLFVMIQRYNRYRIMKLIKKKTKNL